NNTSSGEVDHNHESKIVANLCINVGLIRELNIEIKRVVDLYVDISANITKSMDASSIGDSSGAFKCDGKVGHERHMPGNNYLI
ncbi:protein elf4-like 4, partial [Phtheirospermum japonicum]